MKSLKHILVLYLTIIFIACSCHKTHEAAKVTNHKNGLVGLSLLLYKNSTPGLQGFIESIDDVTSKGINLFGMAPEWPELETAPGIYFFQDQIINPLTLIDPAKTKFKSYILILKVIDSRRKTVPAYLSALTFDDQLVIARVKNLIDNIATLPSIDRISHILIGNEVDGYFSDFPAELSAFSIFYKEAIDHIHAKMPHVKVGTIITFNSLISHPAIFDKLAPNSDFICYTYYPTDETSSNWQMRSPGDVKADINFMAEKAGNKPFAFTEIGYPSSLGKNSSEELQKQFVENMFGALQSYKDKGQLEFIFYHGMYDYPPGFCSQYAQSQGIDSTYLCGFMNSLGLKNYITGQPKQAWNSFLDNVQYW